MAADAITLRLARAADAHRLAVMSRDFIETGLGWRYRPQRMRALIADRDTSTVVAADLDGTLAGFATLSFADGSVDAHLMLLAVQPAFRRQGIGRRLAEWMLETARVAGAEGIGLELRAANDPARRLYRSLGFVETQQVDDYYQGFESALRMRLRLLAPGS